MIQRNAKIIPLTFVKKPMKTKKNPIVINVSVILKYIKGKTSSKNRLKKGGGLK